MSGPRAGKEVKSTCGMVLNCVSVARNQQNVKRSLLSMSVTKEDVRKVARLSRIAVPEERLEQLAAELTGIMGWIEQLNEVDVEGVEPMTSVVAATLPLRDDIVTDGDIAEQILANAPRTEDGFFVVPKAVE
jgi:aspartyl-tRNA(Asn)/glutamyl-tRNA(Gln) amidotransferase subunit C